MFHLAAPVSRLVFSLVVGLVTVCGLLWAVQPAATAAPPVDAPTDTVVLWLVPPETPLSPGPWPLLAEAHQAGWWRQSTTVERRLAALEAAGQIAGFETLPGGVGFLVSAPTGLPPDACRWPEVERCAAPGSATPQAVAAWWGQGMDPTGLVRGGVRGVSTLNLGLHDSLASGSSHRPEPVALSLTRNGDVIAWATATPFPDGTGGYLYAATLYDPNSYPLGGGGYCYPQAAPGDVLQAVQGGQAVSLTVPLLTALADPATAVVYGHAPPSSTLTAYLYPYDDPGAAYQQTVTATANGEYEVDFAGLTPIAPRDSGYVFRADENGNGVYTLYNAPFLCASVVGHTMSGVVAPCADMAVAIYDDTGSLSASTEGYSWYDGGFDFYFSPPLFQAGQTVVITAAGQVVSLTVPLVTTQIDLAGDVVSGEAPANAAMQVDLYRGPLDVYAPLGLPLGEPDHRLFVTATATGTYSADFASLTDVVAGDYGVVYVTSPAGHQAYRRFATPFLRARLGTYGLTGQINGSGPATVTIWAASGIQRDTHVISVWENGYLADSDWGNMLRLFAGDQVTVTTGDGQETGLTMPLLTVRVDRPRALVHGQAPPNSLLRVGLLLRSGQQRGGGSPPPPDEYEYTLWVTSTASGVYTADFSSLTTISPGDDGAVFHVNPQGHEAVLEFVAPIVRVQSGSNRVAGTAAADSDIFVTLRDGSGQVKGTGRAYGDMGYYNFSAYLYDAYGQRAFIAAGDSVELVAGGETLATVQVPTLTVQADQATDVVFGQAPPAAILEVNWSDDDLWSLDSRTWTVTSTAEGTYLLDVSGEADLERGDLVELVYTDGNGNQVSTVARIPRLAATLGDYQVVVMGAAYAPLTVVLLDIDGAPLCTNTTTLDDDGTGALYLHDDDYNTVYPQVGQTLVAQSPGEAMTLTLPLLTAGIEPGTDIVSGQAPPGAHLLAVCADWPWWWLQVTATASGTYSADFSAIGDISSGRVVYLHPDGHHVSLHYATPHVEVTLGEPLVSGVAASVGVVTATLRGADGHFKASGAGNTWHNWNNSFSIYLTDAQQQLVPVAGNDILAVEDASGVTTLTVPALTAFFNMWTGVLTGDAPAGSWLSVFLMGYTRHVQVDPNGNYAIDLSDLSLLPGREGWVTTTDEEGNWTRLRFTVPYGFYLPLIRRAG